MAAPVHTGLQPTVALVAPSRKRKRWSLGHIVMIIAGLLGATVTLLALRATDTRTEISVAQGTLAAGSRISASSFTTKRVEFDDALRASVLTPSEVASFDGATVLIPISAGDPVPKSALVPAAATGGRRSLSLPIAPERAVGGKLRTGDRVDVYTTGTKGTLITTNVEVLDVIRADGGPLSASDTLTVVLAVDSAQATRIAPIVGSTDVVLVQATGAKAADAPTSAPPALTPLAPGTPVAPAAPEGTPGG